ncbi:hypothetical protein [Micromonospora sp. NPDC005710]|uniref:hypothetical protein n=1 Tax=Micromonospora sp. NPDC005710 TaxID=3157051 RepID=UPI0033ED769D
MTGVVINWCSVGIASSLSIEISMFIGAPRCEPLAVVRPSSGQRVLRLGKTASSESTIHSQNSSALGALCSKPPASSEPTRPWNTLAGAERSDRTPRVSFLG